MLQKYNFLLILLFILQSNAMQEERSRKCPTLFSLCVPKVTHQCATSIYGKEIMAQLATVEFPGEQCKILKYSLIQYFSSTFWKNSNKKFSIQTVPSQKRKSEQLSTRINSIEYHENSEQAHFKKRKRLDHDYYKQMLQAAKLKAVLPDNNDCICASSSDKTFNVVTHHYSSTEHHSTEIWDTQTNTRLHVLKSSWLPTIPWVCNIRSEMVNSTIITPDNNFIVVNYTTSIENMTRDNYYEWKNGKVALWDSTTGNHLHTFYKKTPHCYNGSNLLISSVVTSDDSSLLVIGYKNTTCNTSCKHNNYNYPDKGCIDIVDIKTGKLLHSFDSITLDSGEATITSLAIGPDNTFIIIGYNNGLIKTVKIDLSAIDFCEIVNELSDNSSDFIRYLKSFFYQ